MPDTNTKAEPTPTADRAEVLEKRIAELEAENARLSQAVCSGILPDLLKPDEIDALVNFIKYLREQATLAAVSDALKGE